MSTSAELDAPPEYLGTARQHATANVPVAAPADCVDDVLAALRGRRYDAASVIAVVEHGALLGVATIERLLAAHPAATIADVMDTSPPVVAPTTTRSTPPGVPSSTVSRVWPSPTRTTSSSA